MSKYTAKKPTEPDPETGWVINKDCPYCAGQLWITIPDLNSPEFWEIYRRFPNKWQPALSIASTLQTYCHKCYPCPIKRMNLIKSLIRIQAKTPEMLDIVYQYLTWKWRDWDGKPDNLVNNMIQAIKNDLEGGEL